MKQLGWFLLLLGTVLAGDRAGGYVLQQQVAQSQFRYARLYGGEAAADILLVGNSRGLIFYEPYIEEKSGLKTFNLSYNGLPMDAARALAEDYLDRYPAPRLMLIELTTCDRTNDALLAGFLTFSGQSARLDALIREKSVENWRTGQLSALYRYNNELFQRALFHRKKTDKDWLLDREIDPELAAKVLENNYPLEVHPYLLDQLQALVAYAQKKGVAVKLVISPYFPLFTVTHLDDLKAEATRLTGLPVYDYRYKLSDPDLFGDFMHLNKAGAVEYLNLLRADGVLP
ncbi:MAG: hypothetical protein NW218_08785 [Saprospiraceae bacterium]|nr:hypothetical protein [Saprospiraceae bacterium]